MPPRLSDHIRQEVELALRCGDSNRVILDAYPISEAQVRKMKDNLELYDTVAPDLRFLIPQGRPRKVTPPMEQDVLEFMQDNKNALLEEVKEFLFEEWGCEVGKSTCGRLMERLGLTLKQVSISYTLRAPLIDCRLSARCHSEMKTYVIGGLRNSLSLRLLNSYFATSLQRMRGHLIVSVGGH